LPGPVEYEIYRNSSYHATNIIVLPLNTSLTNSILLCEDLVGEGVHEGNQRIQYWDSSLQNIQWEFDETCNRIIQYNINYPTEPGKPYIIYAPLNNESTTWEQK